MTLEEFFKVNNKVAIGFSGGVDSAYLLHEAVKLGADVGVYYVKSQFQPEFEYRDACTLADSLGVKMTVIPVDVCKDKSITDNPANRCYYCKRQIFGAIATHALEDGYSVLLDGTNYSDDIDDRPGFKALTELKVLSPLRICGLTKADIRRLSKEAGLFTYDKPAYACLATRIATGEEITKEKLAITEKAEGFLAGFGFVDFRVRMRGNNALIQVRKSQFPLYEKNKDAIIEELSNYYEKVMFDTEGRT